MDSSSPGTGKRMQGHVGTSAKRMMITIDIAIVIYLYFSFYPCMYRPTTGSRWVSPLLQFRPKYFVFPSRLLFSNVTFSSLRDRLRSATESPWLAPFVLAVSLFAAR